MNRLKFFTFYSKIHKRFIILHIVRAIQKKKKTIKMNFVIKCGKYYYRKIIMVIIIVLCYTYVR